MKFYNKHTYEKLGFDAILQYVYDHCISKEARAQSLEIKPLKNKDTLILELKKVKEFSELIKFDDSFPTEAFRSVSPILSKLRLEGNWLNKDELFKLLGWLMGLNKTREYLQKRKEEYPELDLMVNGHEFQAQLAKQINTVLDERGNIRDNASSELGRIRREIGRSSKNIRNLLYRILRNANDNNWSVEKEITIRNDRLVIPVRAEAKGRVPGFVQDVSQSGGTVYVEPTESLTLNNHIRELKIREHNEVIRILMEVTEKIRPHLSELKVFTQVLLELEMIRAKALLAVDLDAHLPQIDSESNLLDLRDAYYPLLQLKAKKEKFEVVPLYLKLDKKERIIVISGPNAGGKSVSLKTVGLLQLMLQSGFLVPASEISIFPLFDSLFIDIGDEQSVDNDLSTYTSHLYQMRQMGDRMNDKSLFLIDEFGSGTDPKQGGAIAEAFLERFVRQGAYGVITTHYGNLKDFAEVKAGVTNAAMQFDTKELKPTYRLLMGVPGRSYAFEMAKRVGVHYTILKRSRQKVGTEEIDTEKLLKKLEQKNTELSRLLAENKRKEQKLESLVTKNEELKQELSLKRKKVVREAQIEAKALIQDANRKIEQTIREIREKQAEKKATKQLRERLKKAAPEPIPEPVISKKKKTPSENGVKILENEPIQEGDWVKWKDSENIGQLVELQGKRGVVEVGEVRFTVKINQLVKIKRSVAKKQQKLATTGIPFSQARLELNVMGMRVEEALPQVDKLLDEAVLSGLKWVKVLHGKGGGILRDAIRKHLRDYSFVGNVNDAPIDQGGSGWTVVEIRE